MAMQRRVSPRFQNLPNGGNSNIEKISNATDSRKPPNTRVSPRLQSIPSEKRPYYGSSWKKKALNDSQDKLRVKKLKKPNTRVSPRLQSIPLEKRPYNGSSRKEKALNGSQDKLMVKKPNTRVSPRLQSIPLEKRPYYGSSWKDKLMVKKPNTRVSPRLQSIPLEKRPYYGSSWKEKALNDSQDKLMVKKPNTRVSPRLQSIPLEKRPYYGSGRNEKALNDSQDKLMVKKPNTRVSLRLQSIPLEERPYYGSSRKEKALNDSQDKLMVKKLKKPNTRVSPRLQSIPLEKRPYYGSSRKKKASNDSQDKLMVKKLKVDHSMLECVSNGSVTVENGEKDIADLQETGSKQGNYGDDLASIHGTSMAMAVKNELRLFKKYFLRFTKEEDKRCDRVKGSASDREIANGKTKNKENACEGHVKRSKHQGHVKRSKCQGRVKLSKCKGCVKLSKCKGHVKLSKCPDLKMISEVTDYRDEKGISGFKVFKYRLKRLQEQDKLTSQNQVHFVQGKVSRVHLELPGFVCKDISNGQEDKCIPVLNLYNTSVAPTDFKYIKSIQVAKNVSIPPDAPGCNCRGKCTNPRSCSCAQLNGGDFPYVSRDGGRLFEAKGVVFECGPKCGCGLDCVNRASQRGLKYQLEVYCTKDKGWAVRSWDFIPSGAPVCEYVGILRKNDELEDISGNDYIFEIDCWHTMKGIGGRERRLGDVSLPMSNLVNEVDEKTLESEPEPEFCIDASSFGNVARFINHSCDPNLFVQCILSSHHDVRLARIVLFAAGDIPRMQELTYDYNYAIDSVIGPDGKTKQLLCFCGTANCRKRLY